MSRGVFAVERLAPTWRAAFLASHNAQFTRICAEYLDRIGRPDSPFPVRTFIARDNRKVAASGSFYLRGFDVYGDGTCIWRVAMACGIGTLPEYQRQGVGTRLWRLAEAELATEVDGVMLYTSEGGVGYPFYRAQGYLPLFYPRPMRLVVSDRREAVGPGATTMPFVESESLSSRRGEVFRACYHGYGGFMAGRPGSLDRWAEISFFYDSVTVGCTPQISWLEDDTTGRWTAYAIWAGPIRNVGWKRNTVEIWELACIGDADRESLRRLLQPARAAACDGNGQIDWWAVPGHPLAEEMLALGFEERPRSLCILGKLFDPARLFYNRLHTQKLSAGAMGCTNGANRRLEIRIDDREVDIEVDSATRILFGRSTATTEHQRGLLIMRPPQKTAGVLEFLNRTSPSVRWAYFGSEFI